MNSERLGIYAINERMINANNTLRIGSYLCKKKKKMPRLLLITSQSELARRNLRSRKDDRGGRRCERNDSSRSAIHKRLLIPNRDGALLWVGRVGVAVTSSGHCNVKRPSPFPISPPSHPRATPRSSYDQVCYLDGAFTAETSTVLLIFHE